MPKKLSNRFESLIKNLPTNVIRNMAKDLIRIRKDFEQERIRRQKEYESWCEDTECPYVAANKTNSIWDLI